jgi:chromosome segregation ATPase
MLGEGCVNHNARKFAATNVDKARTRENIVYCNENIKAVYKELFGEAVARYNEKQARPERRITDYYEKIRTGKQEKLFYEAIFQVGNKDDMNARTADGETAKAILDDFMLGFGKRNPSLRVFCAVLHMDEETPHLHIDFVPYITGSKRGLDTRVTLKGALAEMGFKGGGRGETEGCQWMEAEKNALSKVMERHGIRWKQLGTKNKHLSVLDYEKQERQKEVSALAGEVERLDGEKRRVRSECWKVIKTRDGLRNETRLLQKEKDEIAAEAATLKKGRDEIAAETDMLRKDIGAFAAEKEHLAETKQAIESDYLTIKKEYDKLSDGLKTLNQQTSEYDTSRWLLPEPGAFESAKSYHESKAKPLVKRFRELIHSIIAECNKWMHRAREQEELAEFYKGRVSALADEKREKDSVISSLQEKAADLERVRKAAGADVVDALIMQERRQEQADKRWVDSYRMGR